MQIQHQDDICAICSSTSIYRKQSNRSSYLIFCRRCGHLLFLPASIDSTNIQTHQERYFNDCFTNRQDQFTKFYEWLNYRRLKKEIPSDRKFKILEIGPGRGLVLHYLEKFDGHQVCGLDISVDVIQNIRERFGIKVMKGQVGYDLNLSRNCYDYIIMRHCLEHFLDPISILSSLCKSLKKNGIIYIAVPNYSSIHRRFRGWSGYQPYHYHYFTIRSLKIAIRKAGLRIRRIYTYESITGWVNTLYRTIQRYQIADLNYMNSDSRSGAFAYMLGYLRLMIGFVLTPARIFSGYMMHGDELIALAEVV